MSFKIDIGNLVEEVGVPGLAIGVGALLLAPILGPALAKVGKPIAKAAIKTGIIAYEKSKGVLAEARETFGDILAESKAELVVNEASLKEGETPKLLTVEANSEAS